MTPAERAELTKEFDKEFVPTKPMSSVGERLHKRARRKPGRPHVTRTSKRLAITMERELVARADALAKRKHLSRSELFAQGVQTLLKAG
jgi:hypothetical protein